jgi:hypothetical protein
MRLPLSPSLGALRDQLPAWQFLLLQKQHAALSLHMDSPAEMSAEQASSSTAPGQQQPPSATQARLLNAPCMPVPVDLLESCDVITGRVRFSGDVHHVGGSEGVRRTICEPTAVDAYLEAPSRGPLKLVSCHIQLCFIACFIHQPSTPCLLMTRACY